MFVNKIAILWPTGEFVPFAAPPSTPAATTASCAATGPPTPQFSYHDINVYALAGLAPHININTTVSVGHKRSTDWYGLRLRGINYSPQYRFRSPCCRHTLNWSSVWGSQWSERSRSLYTPWLTAQSKSPWQPANRSLGRTLLLIQKSHACVWRPTIWWETWRPAWPWSLAASPCSWASPPTWRTVLQLHSG